MDEQLHNDDLLIRYLDGELTGSEKAALEERLKTDKALQGQLTRLQVAIQAVKHLGTTEKVAGIHTEMMQELKQQKAKVVPFNKWVRYTMAVAASVLVLFFGVRLYLTAQLTPEKLYNESFVDFHISASRSNGSGVSEFAKAYQQKNYDAVINSTRSNHLDAKDSLLIGLAYLHTDLTAQAIGFFQRVASYQNNFQQDGEFYLSLSYLKNKNYDNALSLMQNITANPSHLYHKQFSNDFIEQVKELKDK